MLHVAVNAAGRKQTHEMKSASLCLAVFHSGHKRLVLEELAVLDVLGDLYQHLVNDPACADVCMTYLGVAHLTVGETYVKSRCADDSVGALCEIFIQVGLLSRSDSVAVIAGVDSVTVHDNESYRSFAHNFQILSETTVEKNKALR